MTTSSWLVLLCVPVVMASLNQVERRFGSTRAGWIASFPVVGGPALLILALEHGSEFAARAARNGLLGVGGWAVFVLAYRFGEPQLRSLASRVAWSLMSLAAWGACAVWLTGGRPGSLVVVALIVAIGAIGLAAGEVAPKQAGSPRTPLAARVSLAVLLVLSTVAISNTWGARASGVFTTFPIVSGSLILPVFLKGGRPQVVQMASGMLIAGPSLATFMGGTWALLAEGLPAGGAFALSLVSALIVHSLMWFAVSASSQRRWRRSRVESQLVSR